MIISYYNSILKRIKSTNNLEKKLLLLLISIFPLTTYAQDYVWAKSIGGTGYDVGTSITTDALGNIYITGSFRSVVDFDPSENTANLTSASGSQDAFIAKYDVQGNYVWAKRIGGSETDFGMSITTDASGDVYVTGYFDGTADFDPSENTFYMTASGAFDIFFAKYDADGNYIWAKRIDGGGYDQGKTIITDAASNVYIAGTFGYSTADFDPSENAAYLTPYGEQDIFIAKYDTQGNYLWAKKMGGAEDDYLNSMTIDSSGNIYITGSFSGIADFDPSINSANLTSLGLLDIVLAKYDSHGNYMWAISMGSTQWDNGHSIAIDPSNNVYVLGNFMQTVDFDPSSNTSSLTSAGYSDVFIAKYDSFGNYMWAISMGSSSVEGYGDSGSSITIDLLGDIYVTGVFNGTADFDPSDQTAFLISAGINDVFIAKYDTHGNYLWANRFGGLGYDVSTFITKDSVGRMYITGYFSGTANSDSSDIIPELTSAGNEDIFLFQLQSTISNIIELQPNEALNNFIVYPNPSNGIFTIETNEPQSHYAVYDTAGKLVLSDKKIAARFTVDISHLPDGNYLLKIGNATKLLSKMK